MAFAADPAADMPGVPRDPVIELLSALLTSPSLAVTLLFAGARSGRAFPVAIVGQLPRPASPTPAR